MVLVNQTARLVRGILRAWQHKIGFGAVALLVFLLSVTALSLLDLLPNKVASVPEVTVTKTTAPVATVAVVELPVAISIPSIKLEATIANPTTTNVATLDAALHNGAVRYPTSGKLGEDGNVIVFGHSSYLPVVNNPAYKTFNGIQNLKTGDSITVKGATQAYVYSVVNVVSANAGKDGIPLTATGSVLTLATCDSFGTSSDRFIVTARFVESYPLAS